MPADLTRPVLITLRHPPVISGLDAAAQLNGASIAVKLGRRPVTFGPNILETALAAKPWLLFLNQFRNFMVLAATAISLFLGEIADGLTILILVLLSACLGFMQHSRMERSLETGKKNLLSLQD